MSHLGSCVTVQNRYLRVKLSFSEAALMRFDLRVVVAQSLIADDELSAGIVVSS